MFVIEHDCRPQANKTKSPDAYIFTNLYTRIRCYLRVCFIRNTCTECTIPFLTRYTNAALHGLHSHEAVLCQAWSIFDSKRFCNRYGNFQKKTNDGNDSGGFATWDGREIRIGFVRFSIASNNTVIRGWVTGGEKKREIGYSNLINM